LIDAETLRAVGAKLTWTDVHPVGELSRQIYEKGVFLSKEAVRVVEARRERNSMLPKWDILIRPACLV
jgi:hypothetical protein